ncbi:MAG: GNAT family N-acetyltransferase [Persicimonas sp.]
MTSDSLTFEELSAERAQPLRTRVLRPHFEEGRLNTYPNDEAPGTVHFGLLDEDDEAVAVVTFVSEACPEKPDEEAIRLRGMAVAEQWRGKGVGARLLESSMMRLAVRYPRADIIWCNARLSAQGFYERYGFESIGEPFPSDPIGPHIVMWREMPKAVV